MVSDTHRADANQAAPDTAPTFLSYDPRDIDLVHAFVETHRSVFGELRSVGVTGSDAIARSHDERRIIDEIRRKYIASSELAVVLVGERTWTRRFVDWEIAASATHGCGILAIPIGDSSLAVPARLRLLAEEGRGVIAEQPPANPDDLRALTRTAMTLRDTSRRSGRAMKTPLMQRDARI